MTEKKFNFEQPGNPDQLLEARVEQSFLLADGLTHPKSQEEGLMLLEAAQAHYSDEADIHDWNTKAALNVYFKDKQRVAEMAEHPETQKDIKQMSPAELFDYLQFLYYITKNLDSLKKAANRASTKKTNKNREEFLEKSKAYFFDDQSEKLNILKKQSLDLLKQKVESDPKILRTLIKILQSQTRAIDDELIDSIFEIPTKWEEEKDMPEGLYAGTSYNKIKLLVTSGVISKTEKTYDIGAGYGRFAIYAALASDSPIYAVEMVPKRVKFLENQAKKFDLKNLQILSGDATTLDYSDGENFFIFTPFANNPEIEKAFFDDLKKTTKGKKIKIFWHGTYNGKVLEQYKDWLQKSDRPNLGGQSITLLESI